MGNFQFHRPSKTQGVSLSYSNKTLRRWEPDRISLPASLLGVKLTPTALRLWLALAAFANRDNCCWPSSRRLLELLPEGTNSGTLRRARAELEEQGLLVVHARYDGGRQTSNMYELHYPESREEARGEARDNARDEARDNALPLNLKQMNLEQNELKELFENFWISYGKKVGKKAARIQWTKQVTDVTTANLAIMAATKQAATTQTKYRKDPERWLRDHRWEDDPVTTGGQQSTIARLQGLVDREGLANG